MLRSVYAAASTTTANPAWLCHTRPLTTLLGLFLVNSLGGVSSVTISSIIAWPAIRPFFARSALEGTSHSSLSMPPIEQRQCARENAQIFVKFAQINHSANSVFLGTSWTLIQSPVSVNAVKIVQNVSTAQHARSAFPAFSSMPQQTFANLATYRAVYSATEHIAAIARLEITR